MPIMNIPMLLTLIRLLAIPVIIVCYFLPFPWMHPLAAAIFIIAAFTDWLDGYLARSLSQQTEFGAFLDPVADKLLISTVLTMVIAKYSGKLLSIPGVIIVGREIAVSALREWMSDLGKRPSMTVTFISKLKTALQMIALILLLGYVRHMPSILRYSGFIFLYMAAIMTLWTMIIYLKIAWPHLTTSKKKQ